MGGAVIIPSFNSEKTIRRSIVSAINGGYKKIIVYDNNSLDKTREIADLLGVEVRTTIDTIPRVDNWNRALKRTVEDDGIKWVRFLFCGDEIGDSTYEVCNELVSNGKDFVVFRPLYCSNEVESSASAENLFDDNVISYLDTLKISTKIVNPFGAPSSYLINANVVRNCQIQFPNYFQWASDLAFCLDVAKKVNGCYFSQKHVRINLDARNGFAKLCTLDSSIYEESYILSRHIQSLHEDFRNRYLVAIRFRVVKRLILRILKTVIHGFVKKI